MMVTNMIWTYTFILPLNVIDKAKCSLHRQHRYVVFADVLKSKLENKVFEHSFVRQQSTQFSLKQERQWKCESGERVHMETERNGTEM